MATETVTQARKCGKNTHIQSLCLVYNAEQSSAWARQRGFGCADNVENMLVMAVIFDTWQMQKFEQRRSIDMVQQRADRFGTVSFIILLQ